MTLALLGFFAPRAGPSPAGILAGGTALRMAAGGLAGGPQRMAFWTGSSLYLDVARQLRQRGEGCGAGRGGGRGAAYGGARDRPADPATAQRRLVPGAERKGERG